MDAVTYPNSKVINFINEHMIPLKVLYDVQPWAANFNINWTPTIITLDQEGKEHHRTVGFLDPEELIPSLILGRGKIHFNNECFKEAMKDFDQVLTDYPYSSSAPEAVYLRGVARFKSTHDPMALKDAYQQLQAHYPSSEWTKRAYPYHLLEPSKKVA